MTAAARSSTNPAARPSALEVFIARAEARALLWQAGEFDLHQAVDELQAAAERDGLVAEIGQDEVQAILAKAFGEVRDNCSAGCGEIPDDEEDPLLEGLKICADTKRHLEEWERRKAKTASHGAIVRNPGPRRDWPRRGPAKFMTEAFRKVREAP